MMPQPATIAVTYFDSHGAARKREARRTLPDLAQEIVSTNAAHKKDLPWLKLATFGDIRTDKNSLRHDDNVLAVSGIEADYDGELITPAVAIERLTKSGLQALVYTSPSHTPEKPRWRVLCPLSAPCDAAARARYLGRLNGLFGGIFAAESWALSQSYYYGKVQNNPYHTVQVMEGQPIDLCDELDEVWMGKPATAASPNGAQRSGRLNEAELLADIAGGRSYHASKVRLIGKWATDGVPYLIARTRIVEAMETVDQSNRDARWHSRFADIDRSLQDIYGKEASKADQSHASPHAEVWGVPDMAVVGTSRRPPPALPLHLFGDRWGAWIVDAAQAAACPPDYVALPLLATASALIGNARWAQAGEGWAEPPHLWLCVVGDSGSSKSPGADCIYRDVVPELERRMQGNYPDRLAAWRADSESAKARDEQWREDVKKANKTGNPPPAPPALLVDAAPQAPRLQQNDVTIERVATLLASAAPKGLLIVRDELAGWLQGMAAYSDAARPFWLEAYGGRPYRVERQKHPEPINVARNVVAVFGGTQPEKVAQLFEDADDGLLSRLLWAWPDAIPFRLGRKRPAVETAVSALDRLRCLELIPATNAEGTFNPVMVPLRTELLPVIEAFGRDMQTRQSEAAGLMRSALGKARGTVLRLSLVMEMLRWCIDPAGQPPPTEIGETALAAACDLVADYFLPMAERVYGDAAARPPSRNAATLAKWIQREKPTEVHVRTLQRDIRLPRLDTAEAIHEAAKILVDADWLRLPPKGGYQERARAAYAVNPALRAGA
jgi:hypothetical protein